MGFVLPWPIQVGGVTIVLKTKSFHQKAAGGQIKCSRSFTFPRPQRNTWKFGENKCWRGLWHLLMCVVCVPPCVWFHWGGGV